VASRCICPCILQSFRNVYVSVDAKTEVVFENLERVLTWKVMVACGESHIGPRLSNHSGSRSLLHLTADVARYDFSLGESPAALMPTKTLLGLLPCDLEERKFLVPMTWNWTRLEVSVSLVDSRN
jgi:hypothetical protein